MSSFAIDLNSPTLSGSFFVNQFLFAVVIMCSKFILGIVDLLVPQFDRRMLHNYNQFIAATCFGAAAVLIYLHYENVIVLILSIIGIFTVQYTWDACYLATVESMPTSIRGTVLGICSTMARVGALVSPMLVTLSTFWSPTVYTVLAIFGFINFILAWNFLPETKGVNLAEVNLKQKSKNVPTEA
uniref:Major facilitator superfamily (MFS) profile domain-containing protein n=1 Tax=Acrobeloides nanus TaxID=290746 RepID=A0A914DPT2_9BILA